jgi:glycine cleavage system protein P-like pyridoxal-binding family
VIDILSRRGWHPISARWTHDGGHFPHRCGLRIVPIACDAAGNIDIADLRAKCDKHRDRLSAFMVTYPSTHGVFEETIVEMCEIIHEAGGQVYMDQLHI